MNTLKKYFLLTGFVLLSSISYAQITFPDDVDDEAPAAPIDGLITVGLIAGAYLGARKTYKKK